MAESPSSKRTLKSGLQWGRMWVLLKRTFTAWSEDNVLRLSAALAYYSTFSIAPLLVIAIAMAGWVLGPDAARGDLFDQLSATMGKANAATVEAMVQSAAKPGGSFWGTVIGVGTLLLGASGVFAQLKDALNTIWGVRAKAKSGVGVFLRAQLLAFGMVLVIGFLLLTSLLLTTALAATSKYVGGFLPIHPVLLGMAGFLLSAGVVTVLFALIFKVLPDATVEWRHVWLGAGVTSLLFELGKFLLGFYLGRESTASSYGAAGSVILLLLWIYYTSVILFTGAEFTRAFALSTGDTVVAAEDAEPVTAEMRAEEGLAPLAKTEPATRVIVAPASAAEKPIRRPATKAVATSKFVLAFSVGIAAGLASELTKRRR